MEELKLKSKVDIINEVVEFYGVDTNRRSLSKDGQMCVYKGIGNRCCAFAKYVKQEQRKYLIERDICSEFWDSEGGYGNLLTNEVKHHNNPDFWRHIQRLHDMNNYWDLSKGKGLTNKGKEYVANIIEIYA